MMLNAPVRSIEGTNPSKQCGKGRRTSGRVEPAWLDAPRFHDWRKPSAQGKTMKTRVEDGYKTAAVASLNLYGRAFSVPDDRDGTRE
jgi:hypothetical protein